MTTTTASGRGWAYTGVILGGLVSIAANVAHSFIPPATVPAGWAPEPGAVVGAVVWPVFLLIAVEILARVAWPTGLAWLGLRWAGLLPVAFVAALVSYRHLSGLLAHYGEEPVVYYLGPLAVDGLMVMATGALLATGRRRTQPIVPAAVPATATRDIQPSTYDSTAPAPAGPATPNTEMSTVDEPAGPAATPAPAPPIPSPAQIAARITPPATTSRPAAAAVARSAARPTRRPRPAGPGTPAPTLAPSPTDPQVTAPDAAQLTLPIVPPDLLGKARQVVRQYRTEHGTPVTAGQLAVRLKVTSDKAAHILAVLDLDPNQDHTPISTVNGTRPTGAAR